MFSFTELMTLVVELIGIWESCHSAIFKPDNRKIWLEGNVIGIIKGIQCSPIENGYAKGLLRDIGSWKRQVEDF